MAVLSMSDGELRRLEILRDVDRGGLPVRAAAQLLGRSERQVWRLLKAFRAEGAAGLVSKKRDRPSNRKTAAVRTAALWIVRQNYADFGPTPVQARGRLLAAEKLAAEHGFVFSSETVRKWMIADGLWLDRKQRQRRVHQPVHGATVLASWCRSTAASIGGLRIAGRNAPCWCLSTTRPAG
jgi:transposase